MSAPAAITIDIWSDVMCPWCVIGWKQLEKALATLEGEVAAEIRWRPFELNPDMPAEGEDSATHLIRKYGRTPDQAAQGRSQMSLMAERVGYSFAYAGAGEAPPQRMWNTFLAHVLLAHALRDCGPTVQTRLKLALFDAHFRERRNVSDRAVLLKVAEAAGLDRARAEAALDDPALAEYVRTEEQQAWDLNISGVPAMVIDARYLVPGAQEPETYVAAIRRVIERRGPAAASPPAAGRAA